MTTLQKNYDYSNVLWEEIYQRIKTIIRDEYNVSPYISPELNTKINSPFRIWSDLEGTESLFVGGWHKMYTISINQYFKKEDSERFYQRLYQDSERLYQLFFNNQGTQEAELLGFFDGKPQEVSISEEDEYFRVEVIFTCNVFRHDDAIYVETSPSAIRAAIRAIEPSYNFWSLKFDGTDDQINVGSGSSIDNIFDGGGTISMWINPIQQSNTMGIIQKQYVGGWQFLLSDNGGGISWRAKFVQSFDGGSHYQIQGKTRFFSVGNWYNIVISYNNSSISNTATIYVNGQVLPINTDSTPLGTRQDDSSGNMVIGDTGQYEFSGAISDVSLFNTALSSSTIETMYNNGTPILLTRNQGSYNSSGNLVAYYRMGSGDSDARGFTGKGTLSSPFIDNTIFDQTDTSLGDELVSSIDFTDTNSWFSNNANYAATVTSSNTFNGNQGISTLSLKNSVIPGGYIYRFHIVGNIAHGTVQFDEWGGQSSIFFYDRDDTTHALLSGDFDVDFYAYNVNGGLMFNTTATSHSTNPVTLTLNSLSIKKVNGNPGKMLNFDSLDFKTNVPQIYDKALFSNSLVFDGTDDYVDISSIGDYGTSEMTWVVWVKLGVDNITNYILGNVSALNTLFITSDEAIRFRIANSQLTTQAGTLSSPLNWNNIIVTRDDSNLVKIYLNGVEQGILQSDGATYATGGRTLSGTQEIKYIGRESSSRYNGSISSVALFSKGIDQTNVTAIYNSGKPIDLTCDAGNYNNANNLVAYWKMGDGYLDELPSADNDGVIFDQVTPIIDDDMIGNGDFSNSTNWSLGANWEISDGKLKGTSNNSNANKTGLTITEGKLYKLSFEITSHTSGSVRLGIGGTVGTYRNAVGSYEEYIFAGSGSNLTFNGKTGDAFTGEIDNVKAQLVNGNPGKTNAMNASSQSISVPT